MKRVYRIPCLERYALDTNQDCLFKLGKKPHMHLEEVSIFSLNHVIIKSTKIMKNFLKVCKRGSLLGNEEHHLGGDLPIFEIIYSNLEQRSIFS